MLLMMSCRRCVEVLWRDGVLLLNRERGGKGAKVVRVEGSGGVRCEIRGLYLGNPSFGFGWETRRCWNIHSDL